MAKKPIYEDIIEHKNYRNVEFISELDDILYVKMDPEDYYENAIWKVNKKTKEITYMMFTEYIIDISEHAKIIFQKYKE